jgi:hypothetical protein
MYYEEIQNELGQWYWRGTPDGNWVKFDYEKLEAKVNELTGRLAERWVSVRTMSEE